MDIKRGQRQKPVIPPRSVNSTSTARFDGYTRFIVVSSESRDYHNERAQNSPLRLWPSIQVRAMMV